MKKKKNGKIEKSDFVGEKIIFKNKKKNCGSRVWCEFLFFLSLDKDYEPLDSRASWGWFCVRWKEKK